MENKTKIDLNSGKNQNIKQKFVGQHVYLNMNYWLEDYFANNIDSYIEDFENVYLNDEDILENDVYYTEKMTDKEKDEYIQGIRDNGEDFQEIFEYWAISEYLYNQLKANGYCVAYINDTYIWGRCTTGQAILLDYSISKICKDMEILEGQKCEWYFRSINRSKK